MQSLHDARAVVLKSRRRVARASASGIARVFVCIVSFTRAAVAAGWCVRANCVHGIARMLERCVGSGALVDFGATLDSITSVPATTSACDCICELRTAAGLRKPWAGAAHSASLASIETLFVTVGTRWACCANDVS